MKTFLISGVILLGSVLPTFAQPTTPWGPSEHNRQGHEVHTPQSSMQRGLESLQGTWGRVSVEQNGQVIMGPDNQDRLIIRGDRFFRRTDGHAAPSGSAGWIEPVNSMGQLRRMYFTPSAGPSRGARCPILYTLEGGTLRVAEGLPNSTAFPTRLQSRPGDGITLATWQRIAW